MQFKTEQDLLSYNFGATYKNFLETFATIYTAKLRAKLERKMSPEILDLILEKEYANFDEKDKFQAVGYDDTDNLSYRLGKATHSFRVEFISYDSDQMSMYIKVDETDSTSFGLTLKEVLSDKMVDWCTDWLLSAKIHPDFRERIKKNGSIDPIQE